MSATGRYSVLGLGYSRAQWFSDVAMWANSGALPLEFVKCMSVAELRQRLSSERPYSAVMIGIGTPGIDRDVFSEASQAGLAVIAVGHPSQHDELIDLGADVVVDLDLEPDALLVALANHASVISDVSMEHELAEIEELNSWAGDVITVVGAAGMGTSTVAIALAQELAVGSLDSSLVCLADFALNSELALLHNAGDVAPNVETLVDMHRRSRPSTAEIRAITFDTPTRLYQLLLGQRRPSAWTAMTQASVTASIMGLRRSFRTVVIDVTADLDGEDESGSADLEDRNSLARTATSAALCVVVVGRPTMKGLHSTVKVVNALKRLGVADASIVVAINDSPRRRMRRAETKKTLSSLLESNANCRPSAIVHVTRFDAESAHRDVALIPQSVVRELMEAVANTTAAPLSKGRPMDDEVAVTPGSLGIRAEAAGR